MLKLEALTVRNNTEGVSRAEAEARGEPEARARRSSRVPVSDILESCDADSARLSEFVIGRHSAHTRLKIELTLTLTHTLSHTHSHTLTPSHAAHSVHTLTHSVHSVHPACGLTSDIRVHTPDLKRFANGISFIQNTEEPHLLCDFICLALRCVSSHPCTLMFGGTF
jgi:hypothetical protein